MKSLIISLAISAFIAAPSFAHEEEPNVTPISKATELGVHRIERLVTLKKIDAKFLSNLYSMKAQRTTEAGATYQVQAFMAPDANNNSSVVTMLSDNTGKVQSYVAGPAYEPVNPTVWPEKDPLTLMEDALHFVLEGWVQNPEVKNYYLGLTSMTLTASQDAAGQLIALATVTSDDDPRTLFIRLKTDGTFISYEIK